MSRIDGWVVDPKNEGHIPSAVAELIARAMPLPGDHAVADIHARMQARQSMHDRLQKVLRHD
jgi:hypothetical protein